MAVKRITNMKFAKHFNKESSSSVLGLGKWPSALKLDSNLSLSWKASISQAEALSSDAGIFLTGIRLTWM